jgi:hypothetical protein
MLENHKITVTEADEAIRDVDALWFDPDPHSKSGRSIRVIGYSYSRQAILTVILVRRGDSSYWGANGWESNASDRRRYERGE